MNRQAFTHFSPATRLWFERTLGAPTAVQAAAWPLLTSEKNALLSAPTGSGKTLAAFLHSIDRLGFEEPPKIAPKRKRRGHEARPSSSVRVLYVSPLKALVIDIAKNLTAPLVGIERAAEELGVVFHPPTVSVRTGDTPPKERAAMKRRPPEILVTTPESLFLLMTSNAREMLREVDTLIIDEIHQLASTKRGAHLMLTIERLESLRSKKTKLQRVGLSATQRPLEVVADFLGGYDEKLAKRAVDIVDASKSRKLTVEVRYPEPKEEDAVGLSPTAWPAIHRELLQEIEKYRTTLVFVNSRRLAERLASALNELAEDEVALAHHGSLAHGKRREIEDRLKEGHLRALVATSSLELGIDMATVDLVVQIEAPPTIASGVQRIGRAAHFVGGTPRGILLAKHEGDLLTCLAAARCIDRGEIEETNRLDNPLDVLAQQIVAAASLEEIDEATLFALVRRTAAFHALPRDLFESVLDMVAGRYPSTSFGEFRPRVVWDRARGKIRAKPGAHKLVLSNAGTIPDRGLYGVFLAGEGKKGGRRVGELDEEMVFELRPGEVFFLGASSWRAEKIDFDRVLVSPAPGEPGKMPFWHGDRVGRSQHFGRAIGELRIGLESKRRVAAEKLLATEFHADRRSTEASLEYLAAQEGSGVPVPTHRRIVVERFRDEVGDYRVVILTPMGASVHAPWAHVVHQALLREHGGEADVLYTDDGIAFRLMGGVEPPKASLLFPRADEIRGAVADVLGGSALFAARFRENAARALLLPRRHHGKRTPLFAQRRRASDLLQAASEFPNFPILLETYRECMEDVFDLPGLEALLRGVEDRSISVEVRDTTGPSPFSRDVLFRYVATFMYEQDAPLAEKKAQALLVDAALLESLVGERGARELFDEALLREVEDELQRRNEPLLGDEALHSTLLRQGDVPEGELLARLGTQGKAPLEKLERERRVVILPSSKRATRLVVAAEEAGLYRDAIGLVPPRGLPAAFLEPRKHALEEIVARQARQRAPFVPKDLAGRYGVAEERIAAILAELVRRGELVRGYFTTRSEEREFVSRDVLRLLRNRARAAAQKTVAAVSPARYAAFLTKWQRVDAGGRGREGLVRALELLEGAPIALSVLEESVLPARVEDYAPTMLDLLVASGEVTWTAVDANGKSDARVAFTFDPGSPDHGEPRAPAAGELAGKIRELLARRGALFFRDIEGEIGGFRGDLLAAIWELVFAGEVSNDSLAPLRSYFQRRRRDEAASPRAPFGSEGRWFLLRTRVSASPIDLARRLLARYGVLLPEASARDVGAFGRVYPALKELELAGHVRRGYFVEGAGALQFALPGADDMLRRRADGEDDVMILDATDPANAYGSAVPWPDRPDLRARPMRQAGALVFLRSGALLGFLGRGRDALLTFVDDHDARSALASSLARYARERALLLETIDGGRASRSPLAPLLVREGFAETHDGLVLRPERTKLGRTRHA